MGDAGHPHSLLRRSRHLRKHVQTRISTIRTNGNCFDDTASTRAARRIEMSTALQASRRERPFPDLTECINHPSGFFALSPRKDRFTVSDVPGFIAYKEHGKH